MDLEELVLGKIWLPKANFISMVQELVLTLAMYFEQELYNSGIFYLEISISKGKVVQVQMGHGDGSHIHIYKMDRVFGEF